MVAVSTGCAIPVDHAFKDVLMGIQSFLGVTDFYHSYFATVSSIATRIGTALPYYIPSLDKAISYCRKSISCCLLNSHSRA